MKRLYRLLAATLAVCLIMGSAGFSGVIGGAVAGGTDASGFLGINGKRGKEKSEDGFLYRILKNSGYAIITGYAGRAPSEIKIPIELGGADVAAIDKGAFSGQPITRAEIPGNVIYISDGAFDRNPVTTILGYNGTEALSYAKREGFLSKNLSKLYFTDGVIDFSDIKPNGYKYLSKSALRMGALESARLSVGDIFFLPADVVYPMGEAFCVKTIDYMDGERLIGIEKADPVKTITRVKVKDDNMTPVLDKIEVLSPGVTIGNYGAGGAKAKGVIGTFGVPLEINFEWKTDDNETIKVNGPIAWSSTLSADVDFTFPFFNINAFEWKHVQNVTNNIKVSIENETTLKKCKNFSKDLIRVPFASAKTDATPL